MTAPLVPADADLRDFHFMPLDVARLMNSDLVAVATGEEFRAAVILWCRSWHQVPAASLPNDDRMLAHLAGFGRDLKAWAEVKEVALRGFILCDDGRLYHPVIAEKAIEAMDAKKRRKERTAKASEARRQSSQSKDDRRDDDRDDDRDDHRYDARNEVQGTGTGTGTGNGSGEVGTREPLAHLESQLREAAGWQSEPAPMLAVTGEVQALIDAGADLELDVLPVIRAIAPKATSRTTWRYFLTAIARQRDQRIAAANIVSPPTSSPGTSHAAHRKQSSRREFFEALNASIERAERGSGADGDGIPGSPAESAA